MDASSVIHMQAARPPVLPDEICPACGGNGVHLLLRLRYPYPFNLACFKFVPCPLAPEE